MSASPLRHALRIAERLAPVFPLHTWLGTRCSCGAADCSSPAKHPKTQRGVHDATTDPQIVAGWWLKWPDANIGLATGNGLVVLDVDPRHDGDHSLAELEGQHGAIETLTAYTGGGGLHLYLRGDLPARNGLRPGLDLKAAGGYVVAPPSLHASGRAYRWDRRVRGIAPAPAWLVELASPPTRELPATPAGPCEPHGARYVQRAIELECEELAHTPEGQRNERLNTAAFNLARFVVAGEAQAEPVARALTLAACRAGLCEREIERTLGSAFAARGVAA